MSLKERLVCCVTVCCEITACLIVYCDFEDKVHVDLCVVWQSIVRLMLCLIVCCDFEDKVHIDLCCVTVWCIVWINYCYGTNVDCRLMCCDTAVSLSQLWGTSSLLLCCSKKCGMSMHSRCVALSRQRPRLQCFTCPQNTLTRRQNFWRSLQEQ